MLVGLVRDNVVPHAVSVVDCRHGWGLGTPRVGRRSILLVLGLTHHAVKEVLKGALCRRGLAANVISRAAGEGLGRVAFTVSIQSTIS